jgi:hypothetical protein
MARIARVVVPGLPHHVTQRGNPREPVFLGPRIISLPPPDRGGGASRGHRDLLPDAQSSPPDRTNPRNLQIVNCHRNRNP